MARAATPRQPLVVLSEAGFPAHVSSPWRAHRRGARSDDSGLASAPPHSASPFGDDAGDDAGVGVPVAILRAPVTRDNATSSDASTSAPRDVDSRLRRRRTRSDGWGCSPGISWRCARRRAARSGPRESSPRATTPRTTTSFACRRAWRPTSASYPRSAPETWTRIRTNRRATTRTNPRDRKSSSRGSRPFRARPTSRSPPRASPRRSSRPHHPRWTRGRPGVPRSSRWESTFEPRVYSRRGIRSSP